MEKIYFSASLKMNKILDETLTKQLLIDLKKSTMKQKSIYSVLFPIMVEAVETSIIVADKIGNTYK